MPPSIAAATWARNPRLALLGAVSAVAFAALSSTASAQIAVVCNSDTNNDFACGVGTGATGNNSTGVGDNAQATSGNSTALGAAASA